MKRRIWLVPMAGLLLGLAGQSHALTISAVGASMNAGNTANFLNDTLTDYREFKSSTSVLDAGGSVSDWYAASVDAKTRYASTTDEDGGYLTNPTQSATSNYHITFMVSAGTGWSYDVTINTSRVGSLRRVDDGANAEGNIGAISGKLNGVANGTLGSGMGAVAMVSGGSSLTTPFSQSTPTLTLSGLTGTNVITLDFSWSSLAKGTGASVFNGGSDEMAVRLGVDASGTGTTAGDYAVGTEGSDGHFVTIGATLTTYVPEPGSLVLLTAGIAGLAHFGRRRAS